MVNYTSDFCVNAAYPTGISFNSDLRHRNSPPMHMTAVVMILSSHQEIFEGNDELYHQHVTKWMPWKVQLKTKYEPLAWDQIWVLSLKTWNQDITLLFLQPPTKEGKTETNWKQRKKLRFGHLGQKHELPTNKYILNLRSV